MESCLLLYLLGLLFCVSKDLKRTSISASHMVHFSNHSVHLKGECTNHQKHFLREMQFCIKGALMVPAGSPGLLLCVSFAGFLGSSCLLKWTLPEVSSSYTFHNLII